MSLRRTALSGAGWTTASQAASTIIQIGQTAILARLLNPHDYGLTAMAGVVIGFITIYSDIGVSAGIIQKQDINHEQLSSLFILNLLTGVGFALLVVAVAPIAAFFFHESALTSIMQWLALGFVISAAGNQFKILNHKALRFALLGKIEISSAVGGAMAAIICAVQGWGVYSIVSGSLFGALLSSFFSIVTGIKYHRPILRFRVNEIRYFLRFGIYQMGEKTLNYFNSQLDVILIGRLLGTESLGFYSVAKGLCMRPAGLINPIFNRVAFPIMAQVQNDRQALKQIYLKGCRFLAAINAPIYTALIVAASPVIQVLYGEKWLVMVPLMQILAAYSLIRSMGNPVGSLLLSTGRVDLGFKWNLVLFCFIPFAVWYGGIFWGIMGAAFALFGFQCILILPNWWFLVRTCCGASFWEYHIILVKPFLFAAIAGIATWTSLQFFVAPIVPIVQLTFVLGVGALVYLAFIRVFDPNIFYLKNAIQTRSVKGF